MLLDRAQIQLAFHRLDAELGRRGVRAECYVVDGAVLCVALDARPSTKDVDAWFAPPVEVRAAAAAVAGELDLPEDWLNDAAKAFVPANAGFESWLSLPNLEVALSYYPVERIPLRAQLLLEEMFS